MTERKMIQDAYCYALSLTHNEEDAEDLAQTAFLKLYRSKGFVDSKALLITTIRNLFFDQCRRRKLVLFSECQETIEKESETAAMSPGVTVDLDELLAFLRPEEREALYMNAVEGYSAREIAELTAQPRNTVLSLIHRGKKKFRDAIRREQIRIKRSENYA